MPPPYETLLAWQKAHELVLAVYAETRVWPSDERYGLISQARRAAISVAANIAEGSARLGGKELRRFADIGLGSLAELSCLLRIAKELGYSSDEAWSGLEALRNETGRLVYGLARAAVRIRTPGNG